MIQVFWRRLKVVGGIVVAAGVIFVGAAGCSYYPDGSTPARRHVHVVELQAFEHSHRSADARHTHPPGYYRNGVPILSIQFED